MCVRKRQKYKQVINRVGGWAGKAQLVKSGRRSEGGWESHLEIIIII